ncbi:MAG: TetR/AcrR family transcriptional regulator [Anaerolineae bacterium]
MYTREDNLPSLIEEMELPRVPQQARSRQKRDAILEAAGRLFAERGYEATTTDDIAAAAGVSVGTFYGYFHNKRQVFLTLFAASFEALLALRIDELDFSAGPRRVMRETIRRAMNKAPRDSGLSRAWRELAPRDPQLAEYHDRLHRLIRQQVREAFRRAAEQGLTWPDIDLDITSDIVTLFVDSLWEWEPGPEQLTAEQRQQYFDAAADMISRGIFKTAE